MSTTARQFQIIVILAWVGFFIGALAMAAILAGCIPATPGRWLTPEAAPELPSPTPTSPAEPTPTPFPYWSPTAPPGATPTQSCIVDAHGMAPGTVNVRSGPGMNYPVVDTVKEGEELPLFGPTKNGWRQTTTARLVAGWFYIKDWCKEKSK